MTRADLARVVRLGIVLGALGVAGAALAQAMSVGRLQRALQDAPHTEVRFTELRESRWLAAPIESSGIMRSNATVLEKQVEQPRRETWRILGDRMQMSVPGSDTVKEIPLDKAPAAAALAYTLRSVMAGNLEALDKDFELALSGDERDWTLRLTPRDQDVARQLKQVNLQGAGRRLSTIIILEAQGDRTTTRLHYPQ